MKTFEVLLTKSYVVTIKAENKELAKRFSEFYTGDIPDISHLNTTKEHQFEIEGIECTVNDAIEAHKIE